MEESLNWVEESDQGGGASEWGRGVSDRDGGGSLLSLQSRHDKH